MRSQRTLTTVHCLIKKIKKQLKITNRDKLILDNLHLKVAVTQCTMFCAKLFQPLRHTNELERQFTLQCCFMSFNEWSWLWITWCQRRNLHRCLQNHVIYYKTLLNRASVASFAVSWLPVCLTMHYLFLKLMWTECTAVRCCTDLTDCAVA